MIKTLKTLYKTWQNRSKKQAHFATPEQDLIRFSPQQWVIAQKINNQNQKQFLLVEILPFSSTEIEPSSKILH